MSFNSDPQTHKEKVGERDTHTKRHTYTSSVFFFFFFLVFLREFLASFKTAAKKLPQVLGSRCCGVGQTELLLDELHM